MKNRTRRMRVRTKPQYVSFPQFSSALPAGKFTRQEHGTILRQAQTVAIDTLATDSEFHANARQSKVQAHPLVPQLHTAKAGSHSLPIKQNISLKLIVGLSSFVGRKRSRGHRLFFFLLEQSGWRKTRECGNR